MYIGAVSCHAQPSPTAWPVSGMAGVWRCRCLALPVSGVAGVWRCRCLALPVSGVASVWRCQCLALPVSGVASVWVVPGYVATSTAQCGSTPGISSWIRPAHRQTATKLLRVSFGVEFHHSFPQRSAKRLGTLSFLGHAEEGNSPQAATDKPEIPSSCRFENEPKEMKPEISALLSPDTTSDTRKNSRSSSFPFSAGAQPKLTNYVSRMTMSWGLHVKETSSPGRGTSCCPPAQETFKNARPLFTRHKKPPPK